MNCEIAVLKLGRLGESLIAWGREFHKRGPTYCSEGGVQPSENFDKKKVKKDRDGAFSYSSALVWSKSIFAIETALQSIFFFSRQNTFEMIVLAF